MKKIFAYNINYFGTFSRESMRVLRYMIGEWPKKRTFTSSELGRVIGRRDRALGGVLGTFSKREGTRFVIKAGTITVGWQGQKFKRPQQVWALHPKLKRNEILEIKKALDIILLN